MEDHPQTRPQGQKSRGREGLKLRRLLGTPAAFAATACVLLLCFATPFLIHPDRAAPFDDPAFYSWRTEVLLYEHPAELFEIRGPDHVYAGGYRIATPVLGAYLRRIAGLSVIPVPSFFAVGLRVLIPLVLAAWAYRWRRDPFVWHAVALGAGSLMLSALFKGFTDNMMALLLLSAALFFLHGARRSWAARGVLGMLVFVAGFAHPTTFAVFCGVVLLLLPAAVLRTRSLPSALRLEGPVIAAVLAGALAAAASWHFGLWGQSASFSEAAGTPPGGQSFFYKTLGYFVSTVNPAVTLPVLVIGIAALALGMRARTSGLSSRFVVLWLLPLVGVFGFVFNLTYPYYRFINTTAAWLLVFGVGVWFAARFFCRVAQRGGLARAALIGLVGIAAVPVGNIATGYGFSQWANPSYGWLQADERADLGAVRSQLLPRDPNRSVVFVIDHARLKSVDLKGFVKRSGNVARYSTPGGWVGRARVYLGSLENLTAGRPTRRTSALYSRLSSASLHGIARQSPGERLPLVIVAGSLNESGANAGLFPSQRGYGKNVWFVDDGRITACVKGDCASRRARAVPGPGWWHAVRVLGGLALLLAPGVLLLRRLVPDAGPAEFLGLGPALSVAFLCLTGVLAVAVTRSPFSSRLAWISLGLLLCAALGWAALGRRPAKKSGAAVVAS